MPSITPTPIRWCLSLLLLALPVVLAQNTSDTSGMLVCDSATGACAWQAQPSAAPSLAPSTDEFSGVFIDEEPSPVRWLFEWVPAQPSPLRMRRPPAPQCAYSVDEAMGRFQVGQEQSNWNLMISAYDWRGATSAAADTLIDRLTRLGPGAWQARVVQARMGGPPDLADLKQPAERMRWVSPSGHVLAEFSAVQRMDCWFLVWATPESDPAPATPNRIEILSEPAP